MKTAIPNHTRLHLNPGRLYIGSDPCEVTTLLGSCVAVTMFNPRLKMAAICHAMLADPDISYLSGESPEEPFKYVSIVVPHMFEKFRCNGIEPDEIEVKLFGGADVLHSPQLRRHGHNIGMANVERARELLRQFDLRILREHIGGNTGRKLIFNTSSGIVWMKCLKARLSNTTTARRKEGRWHGRR